MTLTSPGAVQTTGPVEFDYRWWQTRYPELAEWTPPDMAQNYFDMATMYCDNTDGGPPLVILGFGVVGCRSTGSPVRNIPQRQVLLGLLTAHIAALWSPLNGTASPNTVGRLTSASEGSVSVSVTYPEVVGAEWYNLTKFGAAYWAATARYRMARYYPAPRSPLGGFRRF